MVRKGQNVFFDCRPGLGGVIHNAGGLWNAALVAGGVDGGRKGSGDLCSLKAIGLDEVICCAAQCEGVDSCFCLDIGNRLIAGFLKKSIEQLHLVYNAVQLHEFQLIAERNVPPGSASLP